MSRRFPDLSHPRAHTSAGEVIGVMVAFVGALMLALLGIWLVAGATQARDLGQWQGTDPLVRQWYKTLMQPDNPHISCCGEADAYWADQTEVKDGKVFAIVTDDRPDAPLNRRPVPPGTRVEIPPHKMTWKHGNPTGHAIVFLGTDNAVLCFVPGGGV